ncbi:hypothetical protein INR49_006230, partial [Caranx melampygus]
MATISLLNSATSLLCRRRLLSPGLNALCLYHKKVVDHYENPRNVGSLDKSSKNVGTGLVGAPACGDVMKLQIQVDENGKIVDAKFKTFGCGSAIASSSLATEWVKGKSIDEALKIKNTDIAKELCLPPVKLHCSNLRRSRLSKALSGTERRQLLLILSTCRLTRADSEGRFRDLQLVETLQGLGLDGTDTVVLQIQTSEVPQLPQGTCGDVSDLILLQQQGAQAGGEAAGKRAS